MNRYLFITVRDSIPAVLEDYDFHSSSCNSAEETHDLIHLRAGKQPEQVFHKPVRALNVRGSVSRSAGNAWMPI